MFQTTLNPELLKNFTTKYLVNMKDIEVMSLFSILSEPPSLSDIPFDTVNRVITSLSKKYSDTDIVTLILLDEVFPCGDKEKTLDWRHIEVRENIIWLLGLSPNAPHATSTSEVLPPLNSSVLSRHLVFKHRNCPQIRNFIKTINTKLYLLYI